MMKAEVLSSSAQPRQTESDKLTAQFHAHCVLEERLIISSKDLFVLLLSAVHVLCFRLNLILTSGRLDFSSFFFISKINV